MPVMIHHVQSFIFSRILKEAELLLNPSQHLLFIQRLSFSIVPQENAPGQAEHKFIKQPSKHLIAHNHTGQHRSAGEPRDKQLGTQSSFSQ